MIQIQPTYTLKDEFESLAKKENLSFEVLELSCPNATQDKISWYENCGLVTGYHGVFMGIDVASGDERIRELSRKECKESVEQAIKCGAKSIVLHSSCGAFLRGVYLDGWISRSAEFYLELVDTYKLPVFIENGFEVDSDPIKLLLKKANSKNIGSCLDIGHANYSRISLEKWVDEIGDKIGYLHLSDNMGLFDDHMPLGDGSIDWKKANSLLAYLPKETPMTLEVGGIDGIKKSLDFLKKNNIFGF